LQQPLGVVQAGDDAVGAVVEFVGQFTPVFFELVPQPLLQKLHGGGDPWRKARRSKISIRAESLVD